MADVKKVLVVDDNESIINLLQDYLPKVIKHELFVAMTGEDALKILEDKRPDVLLLDMQLPGIQGPEVLRIIRDKYPTTKVLVITSFDKQVKEEVGKLGVDGFFPKPIVLSDLINRIEEVLKTEETRVEPVPLADVQRRDDVVPKAKIHFIEKDSLMPFLLPISSGDSYPPPPIEPYGEYEYEIVSCQKDAMPALKKFQPDIVISATDAPETDPNSMKTVSTANLIAEMMKSKFAPKAVIVHGKQQDLDAQKVADSSGAWVENEDMYNYDEEQDKENAERLNKMIWSVCFKHNLVKKAS